MSKVETIKRKLLKTAKKACKDGHTMKPQLVGKNCVVMCEVCGFNYRGAKYV